MKVQLIVCLLLLFFVKQVSGQIRKDSLSPAVRTIISKIIKRNIYEGPLVSAIGTKSSQFERFENLCNTASTNELHILVNYSNPVVRCYAFDCLVKKSDPTTFSTILAHLTDTAEISTLFFDMGGWEQVGDHFLLHAGALTPMQQRIIDSALLYNKKVDLAAKDQLLRKLKPEAKYYDRIREMVLKENNEIAVLALARYKNPNDIGIINNYLQKRSIRRDVRYYAVWAAREFPDKAFYPKLVKIFEHEWHEKLYDYSLWRILYQALAQYPTGETLALFERGVKTKDEFRYQVLGVDLLIAYNKYPKPLFQNIRNSVKLDSNSMEDVSRWMRYEE